MRISKKDRELIKQKYGGNCSYCGIALNGKWQVDHLKPILRNPDGTCKYPELHTFENFMPSCVSCNMDKKTYSIDIWRTMLYNKINLLNNNAQFTISKRYGLVIETNIDIIFYFERYEDERKDDKKGT